MYLVVDHFDSFAYNLVQMLKEIVPGCVMTLRSDAFTPESLEALPLKGLIFSPGPGRPEEYPASQEAIRRFAGRVPILGVCLGHELLVAAFGGKIRSAKRMMHGKTDEILADGRGCFRNIASPSVFMRYHSLVADPETLPEAFEVGAWSRDGDIMAVRHKEFVAEGVQFHPESIGSEQGRRMLENFVHYRREPFPAKALLGRLLAGKDMEREEARAFMLEASEGALTDAQIAGFLCGLEAKGITAAEIAGCVSVLRDKREPITAPVPVLDIVGVGGDGFGSFNLSSMASLAAAACGAPVAKHGNRAVSSFCGSADFFAELGFPLELPPRQAERLLADAGFAFLFAPRYHTAMRHAAKARKELAVRTLMNLLGPLANPAGAAFQVLGVPEMRLLEPMAEAALILGGQRVLTVCSEDGLDEISCSAPTRCVLAEEGRGLTAFAFDPASLGLPPHPSGALKGGTAEDNAAIARRLMSGEETGGVLDAVCLNAGAGLFVAGMAADIGDGYARAKAAFADGSVAAKTAAIMRQAQVLMAASGAAAARKAAS
jgi:anthranilate synthase/phosphoribosyltransferase